MTFGFPLLKRFLLFFLCMLCLSSELSFATGCNDGCDNRCSSKTQQPLLSLGGGMFNIFRAHPYGQFQIEYRFGYRFCHVLLPIAGFLTTSRGSSYLYGGFAVDIPLGKRIALTAGLAAGVYAKGAGKDLHYPIEFRSYIEGAYVFENHSRIGLQLSHISNASLSRRNPGVESIMLNYSFPLKL